MRKPIGKVKNAKMERKLRRKLSIRKTIIGTAERPRVCVTKTNKNLFIQVIDDSVSKTLFSVQTFGKNATGNGNDAESAKAVGETIASRLQEKGLSQALFDRSGNRYSGALKVVAEAMREKGIRV